MFGQSIGFLQDAVGYLAQLHDPVDSVILYIYTWLYAIYDILLPIYSNPPSSILLQA